MVLGQSSCLDSQRFAKPASRLNLQTSALRRHAVAVCFFLAFIILLFKDANIGMLLSTLTYLFLDP